jgi:hypothetical protein
MEGESNTPMTNEKTELWHKVLKIDDGFEYRMFIGDRHTATVYERDMCGWVVFDVTREKEATLGTLTEAMEWASHRLGK